MGQNYHDVVLADRPTNYWRMGEGLGSVFVDSVGLSNGTIAGSGVLNASAARGDPQSRMFFANASGYATLPSNTASANITADVTIEAWVRTTSSSGAIYSNFDDTNANYPGVGMGMGQGGVAAGQVSMYDGTTEVWFGGSTTAINDGRVHHVVGQFRGTQVIRYIDTDVFLSGSACGSSRTHFASSNLCRSIPSNASIWPGYVSDIAVYPYALTATQVLNHYLAGVNAGIGRGRRRR